MAKLATAALLLALGLAAQAATSGERRGTFHGTVQVAEDGTLRVQRLEGVSGALADAVRSQLEARPAVPAVREGRAVATTAPLAGSVRLTPDGERYTIALEQVALRPGLMKSVPILYPVDAFREDLVGTVEVEFALSPDGAPVDVVVVHSSHRYFARALTRPLALLRYATDALEPGRRYRVAVVFQMESRRPETAFACPADPAHARFADEAPCMGIITVTGARVQRGTAVF